MQQYNFFHPLPASSTPTGVTLGWRTSALLAGILLLYTICLMPTAHAQEASLVIRDTRTELRGTVWYLSARIDYQFNRQILDALQNGVRLTFTLQAEVDKIRNWLPDSEVAALHRDYEISWQPLSRGYLVRNLDSDEQTAHTTLFAALHALGDIADLPLIDTGLLDPDARYEVRLRTLLDQQRLPGPLRILAFWDDDFSLESDWHQWPLEE